MAFCVLTSLVQELTLILELEVRTHTVICFSQIIRQEINISFAENIKKVFFNNHAYTAIS